MPLSVAKSVSLQRGQSSTDAEFLHSILLAAKRHPARIRGREMGGKISSLKFVAAALEFTPALASPRSRQSRFLPRDELDQCRTAGGAVACAIAGCLDRSLQRGNDLIGLSDAL